MTAGEQIFKASLKDNLDMFSNLDFETVLSIIKDNGLEFLLGINESDDICEKLNSELDKDKLSSGQKQLINLIRLFFSEKDFVIFDEAAASISEDIEKEYFELLDKISKKHILIIITHNVKRLEKCDKILMLNNCLFLRKCTVVPEERIPLFRSKYTVRPEQDTACIILASASLLA